MTDLADTINVQPDLEAETEALGGPEAELVKRIDRMVDEGRSYVHHSAEWIEAANAWRGDHWKDRKKRKYRGKQWNEAVMNRTFPIIEQQVAMMTDNNPKGVFLARKDTDADFTKDIGDMTQWRARRLNIRARLIDTAKDGKIFGNMVAHVFWDDTLAGNHDVNIRLLKPSEWVIDPDLQSCNVDDAEYIGFVHPVNLDYLKFRWPDEAEKLQADFEKDASAGEDVVAVINTESLDAALGHPPATNIHPARDSKTKNYAQVACLWYRDYTTQKVEVAMSLEELKEKGLVTVNAGGATVYTDTGAMFSQETAPRKPVDQAVYPYGRCTIKAGTVILEDYPWGEWRDNNGNAQAPRYRLWPIAIGANIAVPHTWRGMDETRALRGDQDTLNDMISNIKDHCAVALHPRAIAEAGAVVNPKAIENRPGSMVWMKDGGIEKFKWDRAPEISQDAYKLAELAENNMETTAGMPAQNMGRRPQRQQTATEIVTLDRAGRGRVGMSSALMDEFVSRVYLLMGQTIQDKYDIGRIVRITGDDGGTRAVTIKQGHKDVMFDVEVEAGSTLPYDKQAKKEEAMALHNILGGAYLPELLDAFEVKNKEDLLQRVPAWQIFMKYGEALGLPEVQQYLDQVMAQMQQQQPQGNNQQRAGPQGPEARA